MRILSLICAACLLLSCIIVEAVNEADENLPREPACSDDGDDDADADADSSNEAGADSIINKTKVVVIGCGPGGMFFLHALASKRKKLQEAGDVEGLAALPQVTVYEKASDPGGVWRPNSDNEVSGSINMFGGLWSNSPSIDAEFFDYTFDDHFHEPPPLYLPRKQLLEYMLARVTSVEDIFQHVEFNTEVVSVIYKKDTEKFVVVTKDLKTGAETANQYDKCIWAGGVQSAVRYPRYIHAALTQGGYEGVTMHSAEIVDFGSSIEGKRILLVGDSHSAEDLTLQALKLNVDHVYITSARRNGPASSTSSWPGNKAESLDCLPAKVIHNGTGLLCSEVAWNEYLDDYAPIENGKSIELTDIAAVVYCTGYETNMSYLEEDLRYECFQDAWSAPKGWKSHRNSLTKYVGNVEPFEELFGSGYVCDNIYRHVLIDNPAMMYTHTRTAYFLPEIDATAWSLAAYVTGETVLPSAEDMKTRNYLEKLDELHVPWHRYDVDMNYAAKRMSLHYESNQPWLSNTTGYKDYLKEYLRHLVKLIARDQVTGGHGGGWGSYDKLSERGEKLVEQLANEDPSRTFPIIKEETKWRTFRDIDPAPFESLYTGIKIAPLKGHWMDLDDDGNLLPHLAGGR